MVIKERNFWQARDIFDFCLANKRLFWKRFLKSKWELNNFYVAFIKHCFIIFYFESFNFRRKIAVQYIESSDSEEMETSELPQTMKGNMT